jgi:hypothetical protein
VEIGGQAQGPGWKLIGSWPVAGPSGLHRLDVACGMLGSGKIQAWVDGRLVLVFDKPKSLQPALVSPPSTVDGQEVVIYAESADGGVNINCDAFVNGRSLSTGEPITVVEKREATIADRAPAYLNLLARTGEGVWIIPALMFGQSLVKLPVYPRGYAALLIFATGAVSVTWPVSHALDRAFKSGRLSRPWRGLAALAAYAAVFGGCAVCLVVAYWVARG